MDLRSPIERDSSSSRGVEFASAERPGAGDDIRELRCADAGEYVEVVVVGA